jgi:hypothetical protein
MIDRRTFSTALIAGVATWLLGRSRKAQAQPAVRALHVVLVHGAYADGPVGPTSLDVFSVSA